MINISAGTFLHGISAPGDTDFDRAVVFITEYNAKGAMGFVINNRFPRALNELEAFKTAPAFPLYEGGPVAQEHLFFIHRRPELVPGGTQVAGNVYFGGDFSKAVEHINNGAVTEDDVKIFIGYCGWDPGQLEEEIAEGGWRQELLSPDDAFVKIHSA